MQEILRTLSDRESEALNDWHDLWTTKREFDVKNERADGDTKPSNLIILPSRL
ncbi:hypothetical protein AnigIFM63326_001894 [Aspergillus niger]|nr:hypothetical protein AnigIFM63326_001894 [Aspergillus niger]